MRITEQCLSNFKPTPSENVLFECYQASVNSGELEPDPYQKEIILVLQRIYNRLLEPEVSSLPQSLNNWFFKKSTKNIQPLNSNKGLYIWGNVGRGKTHLVDYFYKILPLKRKLRLHFHRFMQLVHEELAQLDGIIDPLKVIAKNISVKSKLLVLDEMHVNDIADAMLLGRLFEYLFEYDVVLVTTSNIPPTGLYKNGLQRNRFLPAIDLLEQYTSVIEIGGELDYRLQSLEHGDLYYIASGSFSKQQLLKRFHQIAAIELHDDRKDIVINKRHIPVEKWADGVVWFSFEQLCNTARSASDYSQIATIYHTVLISDIPIMDNDMDDATRRFITMIDTFYYFHVNLLVTAHAEPESLYDSGRYKFEFKRTVSRLREMQSTEYLQIKHNPSQTVQLDPTRYGDWEKNGRCIDF